MITSTSIQKEIAIPNCVLITMHSNGIIEIKWDPALQEITKSNLIEVRSYIKEFGMDKKVPVLVATCDFLSITAEARAYSASDEGQEYTLANAVLIDNMAKSMAFNIYMKINKPQTPTRSFSDREKAIEWLLSF
ncbi:MAG: hypothetical protein L6Q66_09340 [Bacteroidia bacterium]|nr:hypothetical protein [Bacteroidia bacterium]